MFRLLSGVGQECLINFVGKLGEIGDGPCYLIHYKELRFDFGAKYSLRRSFLGIKRGLYDIVEGIS